jgi:tetratricopeptide (TPR) repeat protein
LRAGGDAAGAVALYDSCLRDGDLSMKGRASARLRRGLAHEETGDLARAFADFDVAVSLDPALAAAYSSRGRLYATAGELDKAIADSEPAISLAAASL